MQITLQPLEELYNEAHEIDDFLNEQFVEEINVCSERGIKLGVYIARTANMLAQCTAHKHQAVYTNTLLVNETHKSMPPSIKKQLIESMCVNENYMVKFVERLNRAATHQLSYIITLISKAKEEMKLIPRIG